MGNLCLSEGANSFSYNPRGAATAHGGRVSLSHPSALILPSCKMYCPVISLVSTMAHSSDDQVLSMADYPDRSLFFARGTEVLSFAELFVFAPWMCPVAVRSVSFLRKYTDEVDQLPGALPLRATMSPEWLLRVVINPHNFYVRDGESIKDAHIWYFS